MNNRIDYTLAASHRTKRLASLSMGNGRQLAIWQNSLDEIQYSATSGHAFSLYLKGGQGTRRVDGKVQSGKPNSLCVFPEGHSSEWQITETFQFMHFYVANDVLRAAYARIHDQDGRRLDVAEQTFAMPGNFEQPLRKMAQAALNGDVLAADVGFSDLVAAMNNRPIHLTGGLSRKALRNVNEWIDAHIETDIRLSDLAALAGLSEFHFHRMFLKSCGLTPHHWVMQCRIERAKQLMRSEPMTQVAAACGFSSQSHFIRRFKEQTGVTPGHYLRLFRSQNGRQITR